MGSRMKRVRLGWTVTPDGAAGKDTWTMAGKGLNDSDGDGSGNARLAGYDYRTRG
ncbi:hypothetical protein [Streptomyces sp. NBC_01236]|uniref:hypothetical protein n=1 Tax=Streptomyces sp. NBC_01236 TaxID=2903789 RepID=UPI002E0E9F68|nr:hypothetical protein OG324_05995 [Streptomyces sp. NBC_01236]